jgi:hypothetical protein
MKYQKIEKHNFFNFGIYNRNLNQLRKELLKNIVE